MLVANLFAAYPNAKVTEANAIAYERELLPYPRELAAIVLRRLVQTEEWLPPIARMLQGINAANRRARERAEGKQRALEAAAMKGRKILPPPLHLVRAIPERRKTVPLAEQRDELERWAKAGD
jgi:hypothetical protein